MTVLPPLYPAVFAVQSPGCSPDLADACRGVRYFLLSLKRAIETGNEMKTTQKTEEEIVTLCNTRKEKDWKAISFKISPLQHHHQPITYEPTYRQSDLEERSSISEESE